MMYLLIDTNAWMNLLEIDPDEELLNAIEEWVIQKNVQLIVPANLLNEWNNKKKKHVNRLNKQKNEGLKPLAKRNSGLVAMADAVFKEVDNKANRIDVLLQSGIICELTDAGYAEVCKRQISYQAPFHNTQKSVNDAVAFFTMVEDCRRRSINEVYFITYDSDFCSPKDLNKLHPELIQQDISIVLFKNIGVAVNEIKQEYPISVKLDALQNVEFPSIYEGLINNTGLHMVDQLYSLYSLVKAQHPFVPSGILSRMYPFKTKDAEKAYTDFYTFSIRTNNRQLLRLFKEIKSASHEKVELHASDILEVDEGEKKMWDIYKWLNSNLVFSIAHWSEYERFPIQIQSNTNAPGIEYDVFSLRLSNALSNLSLSNPDSVDALLEKAYYEAYFGRFGDSAKAYYKALQLANKQKLSLLCFICVYNIKQLDHLYSSYFREISNDLEKIFLMVRKSPLHEWFLKYSNDSVFYRDCIKYLMDKTFFVECMESIVENVEQIRQHYHLQLRGGYSKNSHVSSLIWAFAHLEAYLDRNRIVFSCFSDFSKLFDRFLEGLIIAHSMSEKQECRLDKFDDYLLLRVLYYADSERLFRYLKRYNVRELRYESNNYSEDRVDIVILKFWEQHLELQTMIAPSIEVNGLYFWQKYQRMISSSLTILALVSFDESVYKKFGKLLVRSLKSEVFVKRIQVDFLSNVIREKGQLFHQSDLNEILEIVLATSSLHVNNLLQAFCKVKKQYQLLELSSDEQYDLIVSLFYGICPKCNQTHKPDLLYHCFNLFNSSLKERLRDKIEADLNNNFSPDNYYIFSIYRIVDYKKFFHKYHDSIPSYSGNVHERDRMFGDTEVLDANLSQLLNLIFQENPENSSFSLQRFKGLSPYYDWLIDMENFNYDNFNPEWILEYQTQPFLKRIFSNAKVRIAVKKYILKGNHTRLSELYVIYDPYTQRDKYEIG